MYLALVFHYIDNINTMFFLVEEAIFINSFFNQFIAGEALIIIFFFLRRLVCLNALLHNIPFFTFKHRPVWSGTKFIYD